MALLGLKVRGLSGLGLIGAGYLLATGYTGHCAIYSRFMHTTALPAEPSRSNAAFTSKWRRRSTSRGPSCSRSGDFENLPRFMEHLQSVTMLEDNHSHWVAKGPAGTTVEWDAEIINEEKDETIAWRSLGGATVDNAGSVRFIMRPATAGRKCAWCSITSRRPANSANGSPWRSAKCRNNN